MQQEPVAKLNSLIKAYGPLEHAHHFHGGVYADTIYDLIVVSTVEDYYKSSSDLDFFKFIPEYLQNGYLKTQNYRTLSNFINRVESQLNIWNNDRASLMGDVHPKISKVKINSTIQYQNLLNIETFFSNLKRLLNVDEILPNWSVNDDIVTRKFIRSETNISDLSNYYHKVGKLLAFSLFIKTIDLHDENILIDDMESPILFDLEFAFSPNFNDATYGIESCGLLNAEFDDNRSAILGGMIGNNSLLKPVLLIEENLPKIIWETKSKRDYLNIPSGKSDVIHPIKYWDNISIGFLEIVSQIQNNISDIKCLVNINETTIKTSDGIPIAVMKKTPHEYWLEHVEKFNEFQKAELKKIKNILTSHHEKILNQPTPPGC